MEPNLDILNRVNKAEPSPFLYTRIIGRIQQLQDAPASVRFRFAFAATAIVLLVFNLAVLLKRPAEGPPPAGQPSAPYSSTQNNIYHE